MVIWTTLGSGSGLEQGAGSAKRTPRTRALVSELCQAGGVVGRMEAGRVNLLPEECPFPTIAAVTDEPRAGNSGRF